MPIRGTSRFVPRGSVTVAFENGKSAVAYGVIANLSRGGACVWTNAGVEVGQEVALSLSFACDTLPIPTEGRVVWTAPLNGHSGRSCGVQWKGHPRDHERLQEMIDASA
jgi:Tfp pilus assembly protein PilZ